MDKKEITKKEKNVSKVKNLIIFNILAAICVIIFSAAVTPKTLQNDTFYTIKVGETICNNGVDMQEHFSWHEGLKYTYPHWLYDVATYQVYSHFGFAGIYYATMILACTFGLTLYFTNSKLSKNCLISLIFTCFEMIVLSPYIAARAQLVSFILFVLTNFFIEKFLETRKVKYAVGLLIIPIVIANVHAAVFPFYFVFYIPAIAEYLIAIFSQSCFIEKFIVKIMKNKIKKIEKKKEKLKKNGKDLKIYDELHEKAVAQYERSNEKLQKIIVQTNEKIEHPYKFAFKINPNVKWLALIMILAAFTGLLTPIGDTPYTYLYHTMKGNTTTFISEHLPMTLSDTPIAMVEIGVILAFLLLTKTKINLRDGFMLAGMCLLMLFTRRQLSMFTIIFVIVICKIISAIFDKYDPNGTDEMIKYVDTIPGQIFVICLAACIGLLLYKDKKDSPYVDEATYPVKAAEYIKENLTLDDNSRLFNGYDYGSYLLYKDIPVFIDSRADVYDPQFNGLSQDIFTDTMNIISISVYYENKFEEYDIKYVMSYRNTKLVMLLLKDDNYKLKYYDDNFVIFERLNQGDTSKNKEEINQFNQLDEENKKKNEVLHLEQGTDEEISNQEENLVTE